MKPNFKKFPDGLIPAVVQDATDRQVLMLGYMNAEALARTQAEGRVCFYSRSKKRLWTKGESSGCYLNVVSIELDCDQDAILVKAVPQGPVCHKGTVSCFGAKENKGMLYRLEHKLSSRIAEGAQDSYTSKLYHQGINKVAQKLGEEAVELIIEAKDDQIDLFKNEAADLLYHFLLLLQLKGVALMDVEEVLQKRAK